MIHTDILSRLLERRQIAVPEYLAGREWQRYLEDAEIQGSCTYDWDAPLVFQTGRYQSDGDLNERQTEAYDIRRLFWKYLGAAKFNDLDRILSAPDYVRLRLDEQGVAYVSGVLRLVSIALSIQANGGDPFPEFEEWERSKAEQRVHDLKMEQPWLFDAHRRQPRKASTNEILGRNLK